MRKQLSPFTDKPEMVPKIHQPVNKMNTHHVGEIPDKCLNSHANIHKHPTPILLSLVYIVIYTSKTLTVKYIYGGLVSEVPTSRGVVSRRPR